MSKYFTVVPDHVATKRCSKCGEIKPTTEFATYRSMCKPCKRFYARGRYKVRINTDEKFITKRHNARRKYQAHVKPTMKKINDWWLQHHPCIMCGETNSIVLAFHHIDPTTKKTEISRMKNTSRSPKTFFKEILKCIVLCHNCHAIEEDALKNGKSLLTEYYNSSDYSRDYLGYTVDEVLSMIET